MSSKQSSMYGYAPSVPSAGPDTVNTTQSVTLQQVVPAIAGKRVVALLVTVVFTPTATGTGTSLASAGVQTITLDNGTNIDGQTLDDFGALASQLLSSYLGGDYTGNNSNPVVAASATSYTLQFYIPTSFNDTETLTLQTNVLKTAFGGFSAVSTVEAALSVTPTYVDDIGQPNLAIDSKWVSNVASYAASPGQATYWISQTSWATSQPRITPAAYNLSQNQVTLLEDAVFSQTTSSLSSATIFTIAAFPEPNVVSLTIKNQVGTPSFSSITLNFGQTVSSAGTTTGQTSGARRMGP